MKNVSEAISALTYKEMLPYGLELLSGESGTGKTIMAQQYAYENLLDNGTVLWITTEELPKTLRTRMAKFGWNTDRFESEGRFKIVDVVSSSRLGINENLGSGVLGLDPTGILINVTEELKRVVSSRITEKFVLVMDSVSRLLLTCETKAVIDFVSCLSSRLENYHTRGILTVTDGAHDVRTLNALTFSTTGTIRFRIREEGEHRLHQFRIETLRGRHHDDSWKNYTITNTGLDIEV